MSNGKGSGINVLAILGMIVGSPILLVLLILSGVLAVGKMLLVIENPLFIAVILIFDALLYRMENLNVKNIVLVGLIFGGIFWLISLAMFFGNMSGICSTPILGALICGGISIVSIFTDGFGYILGGIVLSSIIGGLMMLVRRA